jgi:hypothetical protein
MKRSSRLQIPPTIIAAPRPPKPKTTVEKSIGMSFDVLPLELKTAILGSTQNPETIINLCGADPDLKAICHDLEYTPFVDASGQPISIIDNAILGAKCLLYQWLAFVSGSGNYTQFVDLFQMLQAYRDITLQSLKELAASMRNECSVSDASLVMYGFQPFVGRNAIVPLHGSRYNPSSLLKIYTIRDPSVLQGIEAETITVTSRRAPGTLLSEEGEARTNVPIYSMERIDQSTLFEHARTPNFKDRVLTTCRKKYDEIAMDLRQRQNITGPTLCVYGWLPDMTDVDWYVQFLTEDMYTLFCDCEILSWPKSL